MTSLSSLDLSSNHVTWLIPDFLSNLYFLSLNNNFLTGSIPNSVASLHLLGYLSLGDNMLIGSIRAYIGNFSYMGTLDLSYNSFTGSIPESIALLTQLTVLNLADNNLTGSFPTGLKRLSSLQYLDCSANQLSGSLATGFELLSSMSGLVSLALGENQLTGSIPAAFANIGFLETLDLSGNLFTGSFPNSITVLNSLTALDLAANQLSGSLPSGVGNLVALEYLYLSTNNFTGSIPNEIGNLASLKYLDLSSNSLSGSLPNSITSLGRLRSLGVNNTNLSGTLPTFLGLLSLDSLNISSTKLTCPPDYTSGCDPALVSPKSAFCHTCRSFCNTCGQPSGSTANSSASSSESSPAASGGGGGVSVGAIVGISVAAVAILLLLLGSMLLYLRHKMQQKPPGPGTSLAAAHCTELSLEEVLKATNDWSQDNLLGSGTFGDVYKGVSPRDGTTPWAVKRAKLIGADFQKEVEQMADKNHPNIVRLLGFAVGGDMRTRPEQVLIYEFVPNGDLHKWRDQKASQPLSLQQQLDILIGVARGLEYLHSFKIVHRDIKPANILIGDDMQAKIADFGVARMVEGTTVGKTQHAGTPGYMDPAYIKTYRATTASDVYSFGVLMLVVLSGRPDPTDCDGNGQHILQWASECLASGNSASLKDPTMDAPDDAVLRLAELAVSCTVERTASRPSMAHIATQLQAVREEVAGREELREALKVDTEVQEMREDPPGDLDEELKEIGVCELSCLSSSISLG